MTWEPRGGGGGGVRRGGPECGKGWEIFKALQAIAHSAVSYYRAEPKVIRKDKGSHKTSTTSVLFL